tara:strand:- start:498 stop:668 length:171 start_codon:yes stop_codon:yes gene_type:complete
MLGSSAVASGCSSVPSGRFGLKPSRAHSSPPSLSSTAFEISYASGTYGFGFDVDAD